MDELKEDLVRALGLVGLVGEEPDRQLRKHTCDAISQLPMEALLKISRTAMYR